MSTHAARDADAMLRCYHPEVQLSDAVFVGLDAPHTRAMWRMLLAQAPDLTVDVSAISADDTRGTAHWDARYTFPRTGRRVLNQVDATFALRDGRIVRHVDTFDLPRWTRQALGLPGVLFGWSSVFQRVLRRGARAGLDKHLARHPDAGALPA